MALFLLSSELERLNEQARRAYPEECLGLLLGRQEMGRTSVVECFPLANAHPGCRRENVSCTPQDYLKGERRATQLGLEVCGFYHSHPDQPPVPSQTDLNSAAFSDWSYLIVSVSSEAKISFRSWTLVPQRTHFEEEKIVIQGACYA